MTGSRGLVIARRQLESYAGRSLTDSEVERIERALPHSSIPEALATIADALREGEHRE